MNAGIGTSLSAVLDEIVGIHAEIPVDGTYSVAPEITVCFLETCTVSGLALQLVMVTVLVFVSGPFLV